MSGLYIDVDLSEWYDALDVLSGPGSATLSALNRAMIDAFEEAQSIVHVQTGSLRGSGRLQLSHSASQWSGTISYGGPSPGYPNDPVLYAEDEFSRGCAHDALRNVHYVYDSIENALVASVNSWSPT